MKKHINKNVPLGHGQDQGHGHENSDDPNQDHSNGKLTKAASAAVLWPTDVPQLYLGHVLIHVLVHVRVLGHDLDHDLCS